jgi:hypothetical protein
MRSRYDHKNEVLIRHPCKLLQPEPIFKQKQAKTAIESKNSRTRKHKQSVYQMPQDLLLSEIKEIK